MKRFLNSRPWLGMVSVFFAILLFLTAASSNHNNSSSQIYSPIETYTHSLKDVPIDMKYDSDKYFISGYSYGAEVYLTSTNRIKLDSEVNNDTRNFKIVADLTHSYPGTVSVNLRVENLPFGVTATVSPDKISVTIGKKESKVFPVRGSVDAKQIANGYEISKIETGVNKVEVTSDESTIALIDHVVAKLPDDQVLDRNYSSRVTLQAVSADGTILASAIDPAKTNLSVAVKKITKSVPIRVEAVGMMDDSLSDIQYKLSKQTAVISGSREVLEDIDEIIAEVNISDVTKNTSKTVSLSSSQVSIEPSVVTVQLTTTKK
ncbi:TPA: YbbR-like domain-containing protein [Streptococcus pyogenes]|nr:YbbR-like domain-containing protein [Streptococcus pyogenes]HEQ8783224.1 YbbR-like domain-containing protein [Streptococcus pyogenes]HEQ9117496.1 YbbR-like domain-containing protein [Streptococcus pyogenes]HEQ9367898.1 YbbR-like domain-containing protein [Streptococcus pyogenes]HEQ9388288.1 YbbR-like domain-containing protein [Streptococcus pyogenes]